MECALDPRAMAPWDRTGPGVCGAGGRVARLEVGSGAASSGVPRGYEGPRGPSSDVGCIRGSGGAVPRARLSHRAVPGEPSGHGLGHRPRVGASGLARRGRCKRVVSSNKYPRVNACNAHDLHAPCAITRMAIRRRGTSPSGGWRYGPLRPRDACVHRACTSSARVIGLPRGRNCPRCSPRLHTGSSRPVASIPLRGFGVRSPVGMRPTWYRLGGRVPRVFQHSTRPS